MTATEKRAAQSNEWAPNPSGPDSRPWVIAVVGPTAVGKTGVAVELGRKLETEIFSCDARQFYEGMAIGTAQPTAAERSAVRHHFVDFIDVGSARAEAYSAGRFAEEAVAAIADFQQGEPEGRPALVVGGSGLYAKALLEGLDETPRDTEVRAVLSEWQSRVGLAPMLEELAQRDPVHYERIDQANPQRIIRALEVCRISGRPFSSFHSDGPAEPRPFRVVLVGLEMDRSKLNERIDRRVVEMAEAGWEEEARALMSFRHTNALKTVGYREWFAHFDGKLSREETIASIQQSTRQYAKRQMTWFKKMPGIKWFDAGAQPVSGEQNQAGQPNSVSDILGYVRGEMSGEP